MAVDDLALDLGDHAVVAEGDFADVGRAEVEAPLGGRGRDLFADFAGKGVAVFEENFEAKIGELLHDGGGDVGLERADGVGILEEIGLGIVDEHLEPDADAHRGALLGVDELVAQVGLLDEGADGVGFAE
jgi:hypothetical protein